MTEDIDKLLAQRLGRLHARLRLGLEADHEAQVFGQGINYFHIENLRSSHIIIEAFLKLTGLYERGCRNAEEIEVRHTEITSPRIPVAFDQYTILHISDLHSDMSQRAMVRLGELLQGLEYDLCVFTGDYRGKTFGPYDLALSAMSEICSKIEQPIYGVLGNHDTISDDSWA